ncbi:Hypothetical Protein FCC1311_009452 [Hondaea fermentalgiana]|uniref:Uncharacterized protein n=1 Tax=Hondaea fermentalgiana TaxID=2315210 RepID=A0A2R5G129_9STRA|nr:Hypothetical Protein FCC1311_009452 [Hondaea fermentalgiana]|eukprot:GBG24727.1 Hypothetical Protein FCC1311_009452 [Hondaea fermentalgiana]
MQGLTRRVSASVYKVAPGRIVRSAPAPQRHVPNDEEVEEYLENMRHIPPEKTGGKTAEARVRRLSKEQQSFRSRLLETSTPLTIAREHILKRWTHAYLVLKLALTALLAILLITFGFLGAKAAEENEVDQFAFKIMTTFGFLILFSSLLGIYGAGRVKRDLLKDDDGMGTPGQQMLEIFFHVSFAFNVMALPIAMAILTDRDAFLNDGAFGDMERYATAGASIILIVSIIMMLAMRRTIQIVTMYEMAHSFLESFSTLLVGVGVIGLLVAFSLLEFGQGLEDDSVNASIMTVLYVFISLCAMLIVLSVLGYGAALIEHIGMLKLHLASMAVLSVCIFAVIIAFASTDVENIILSNCRSILQIMAEEWWQSVVACEKYGGSAMGAKIEIYDADTGSYSYVSSGVGTSAQCPLLNQTAFAWEYYVAANASSTVFEGCLNEACCQVLANHLLQHITMIVYGSIALFLCCMIAVRADWWLIKNTPPQRATVKLISRRQARMLLGLIAVIIVAFIVTFAVFFNDTTTRIDPQAIADQLALQAFNSSDSSTVVAEEIHLCTNGIMDGNETGIDCGGSVAVGGCQARCAVGRGCTSDSDCISGKCNSTSLVCRRETAWEQCNNGVRDGAETGVDCGGGTCRSLLLKMIDAGEIDEADEEADVNFLCSLREACSVDSDCASKYCDAGKCASCQDNRKNTDEGDVDCGSPRCIEYYETYPEASPDMFVANGTSPAADEDGLCLDGRTCTSPSQCSSGVCSEEYGVCVSCSNGIQDGDETGIDCGGKVCQRRCAVGEGCRQQYDCRTQRCTSNCSAGVCGDGVCESLFSESDLLNADLPDLASYTAISIDCTDGERSSHETDIDCGGTLCPSIGLTCEDGQSCTSHGDCSSALCYGGECVSCENGIQDGQETDIDCGGAVCSKRCARDKSCVEDNDCRDGYFCWTNETYQYTLEMLAEQNLTDLLDDLELPEDVNTCQRVSNLTSEAQESAALSDGLTLDDCFVPAYEDSGPEQAAAQGNESNVDEDISDEESQTAEDSGASARRRLSRRNRHSRRLTWGRQSSSGTYLYSFWPYFCKVVSSYTTEDDIRFEVEKLNDASVEVVADNEIVVTRSYGSGTPDIQIYPSSCSVSLVDGVTITRTDSVSWLCKWLDLPSIRFVSLDISSTTTLQGSVVDVNGNPIENAYVRFWSSRKGSCTDSDARPQSCDDTACNVFDSVYSSCSKDNADCCTWTEDEDLLVTSCTDGDASTTPLVDSTSDDGSFYVSIPTLDASSEAGGKFRLTYTVTHDEYMPSQGNLVIANLGDSVSLSNIQLTARPLTACSCASFEGSASNSETKLCKNPVTAACALPGNDNSCASYTDREACDNTITAAPTSAPTAKPTALSLAKGNIVESSLITGSNYIVEFTIQLHAVHSDWRNVLFRGNSWNERSPAIWIYPDTPRLHIRFSTSYDFNEGCDPANLLTYDQEYLVRIEVYLNTVEVYIDNVLSCSAALWGTLANTDVPLPLYVSSPDYEAASCTVGNLSFSEITDRPVPSPTPEIPRLTPGTIVDTLSLTRNWQFDMRITVYDTTSSWANVLHFGNDKWSERIWILWLVPGTTRLSVKVNTITSPDSGCESPQALTIGQTYDVHVEVFETRLELHIDGTLSCYRELLDANHASTGENLYVSGPWYTGAPVEVEDLTWSDITDRPTPPPTTIPQLTQGDWSQMVALEANWFLEFKVTLFAKTSDWSSVLHLGDENYNRGPGIWFYPGSSRLHVRTSLVDSRNAGCDPGEHLELGREYHVRLEFLGYTLSVYYDETAVCTQTFLSPFHVRGAQRLYISDPWYTPAKATVTDVAFGALANEATPAPTVALLPSGNKLFDVTLSTSWQLNFDLVVHQKRTVIAELIHVGNNAQERGPVVGLMPYSSALQIRVSTTEFWNDGCNTKRELELGRAYAVQVQLYAQEFFVKVDGVTLCRVSLSAPMIDFGSLPVWSASSWATPAYAQVSNVNFQDTPCDVCDEATIRVRCDNYFRFRQYEMVDGDYALVTTEHASGVYDFQDWRQTWTRTVSVTPDTRFEFECYDVGVVGGFAATVETCGETFRTDENVVYSSGNRPFEFFVNPDKTDASDTSLVYIAIGQGRWGSTTYGTAPLVDSSVMWVWNQEIWNTMTFGFNMAFDISNYKSDTITNANADADADACADGCTDNVADTSAHISAHTFPNERADIRAIGRADCFTHAKSYTADTIAHRFAFRIPYTRSYASDFGAHPGPNEELPHGRSHGCANEVANVGPNAPNHGTDAIAFIKSNDGTHAADHGAHRRANKISHGRAYCETYIVSHRNPNIVTNAGADGETYRGSYVGTNSISYACMRRNEPAALRCGAL